MKLQLVFDKPISISSASDSEQLRIEFANADLFYDQYGQTLKTDTILIKNVPQQFAD